MPRIMLVDDSSAIRVLLGEKLRTAGYEVEELAEGTSAAERALQAPPDIVVTDLWMPGISGVQLCRLLKAEPVTASVPVVFLSGADDRRSRFWARSSGAAAFVNKTHIDGLLDVLRSIEASSGGAGAQRPGLPREGLLGTIPGRLSNLLDTALFESVIAGDVRALAQHEGEPQHLFAGLVKLASDVVSYAWLALLLEGEGRLLLHAHPAGRAHAEKAARAALRLQGETPLHLLADERPLESTSPSDALVANVLFAGRQLARLALGAGPRGATPEDQSFFRLVASELGGPLQMLSLVEDTRRLAATDALTNLLNRRAFTDAMDRERSRSIRHGFVTSLLMLDIDHFKRTNDTHGHAVGDSVLQTVARLLAQVMRRSDYVARWGGEEFVIGLTQTDLEGAQVVAERTRHGLEEIAVPIPGGTMVKVTVSVGVASAPPGWKLDELVGRADRALYKAKNRGRNCVEVG